MTRTAAAGVLEAGQLFAPTLPAEFAAPLELLAEIERTKTAPSLSKAERRTRAVLLYERLTGELSRLLEPTPSEQNVDSPAFRSWFVEAVLLWIRFGSTGSTVLFDSVGAETLAQFPVDLPPSAEAREQVTAAVTQAFALSPEELAQAVRKVEHLTSNLELKRRIADALAFELTQGERQGPAGRVRLLQEIYGFVPFRPGDVDIVIASTAFFFFVPRKGTALELADFRERPADEQGQIREFLEKVDRANTAETRRFPSFGLHEPEAVSDDLLARLSRATGVTTQVVAATLATMFSLIQRSLHAQYLVHDLWGHTWQEALAEFEWEYALLPRLDRALTPADGPEFGGPTTPSLGSAFRNEGGTTVLDEGRLLAFADGDLRGRIQVGTSVPLSEVLADFMESKFSRARPALELPTSSLIPSTSLKVDLTIADTRVQVDRYTRPYRRLAVEPADQLRLAGELEALGLPRPGLEQAVARAGRTLFLAFESAFDASIAPVPVGRDSTEIRGSVLRRLLLQFAIIMVNLERALGRLADGGPGRPEAWRDPKASADLTAVALTHFYEQNRQSNFWHMDQIARNELEVACERLRQGLPSTKSGG